jgi:hypothetical protein
LVQLSVRPHHGWSHTGPLILPGCGDRRPEAYVVAFENDVARFLRVNYGPGEKSPMHRHLPGCVVFLTDQTFNFTLPGGKPESASVPAGALGCSDGNVHAAENIEEAAEFIMVEFKDRKTFRDKYRRRSDFPPST